MSTSPRNLKQAALYVEVPFRGPLQIGALAVTGGILLVDGKKTTPAWILGGNCIIRTGGPFLQGLTTEAPVRHPQPRSPLSRELSSPEDELKKRGFSVEQRLGPSAPNVRPQAGSSLLARMEPAVGGFRISRCQAACPHWIARATHPG